MHTEVRMSSKIDQPTQNIKKSKLKNADDIKADVDVNYEDASGIRGTKSMPVYTMSYLQR